MIICLKKMEVDTPNSHPNEKKHLECSSSAHQEKKCTEADSKATIFVNNATITWHKSRREWIGDQNQKLQKMQKDPIISWSMTYEDLLSNNEPFSEPIPLREMVDFLVDIWHDEGLFD